MHQLLETNFFVKALPVSTNYFFTFFENEIDNYNFSAKVLSEMFHMFNEKVMFNVQSFSTQFMDQSHF